MDNVGHYITTKVNAALFVASYSCTDVAGYVSSFRRPPTTAALTKSVGFEFLVLGVVSLAKHEETRLQARNAVISTTAPNPDAPVMMPS